MERNGYWPASGASQHPEGLPALLLSRLAAEGESDGRSVEERVAALDYVPDYVLDDARLTQADLADLRELVGRLPQRERLAVVMRFWQQASEAEIALALGGVSTRTVRYTLTRAYRRLRAWYAGDDGPADITGEAQHDYD
jgi:DNA-directed RNA polymerase specialized sigma24 family protein